MKNGSFLLGRCDRLRTAHRRREPSFQYNGEERSSLRFRLTIKTKIHEQSNEYKGDFEKTFLNK